MMNKKLHLLCPCASQKDYMNCCGLYLSGKQKAPTPEALMRSRYTAFAKQHFTYLQNTMCGEAAKQFDMAATKRSAPFVKWIKLEVIQAEENGNQGIVEFNAHFQLHNKMSVLHEMSAFEKINGEWFYTGESSPHSHFSD